MAGAVNGHWIARWPAGLPEHITAAIRAPITSVAWKPDREEREVRNLLRGEARVSDIKHDWDDAGGVDWLTTKLTGGNGAPCWVVLPGGSFIPFS